MTHRRPPPVPLFELPRAEFDPEQFRSAQERNRQVLNAIVLNPGRLFGESLDDLDSLIGRDYAVGHIKGMRDSLLGITRPGEDPASNIVLIRPCADRSPVYGTDASRILVGRLPLTNPWCFVRGHYDGASFVDLQARFRSVREVVRDSPASDVVVKNLGRRVITVGLERYPLGSEHLVEKLEAFVRDRLRRGLPDIEAFFESFPRTSIWDSAWTVAGKSAVNEVLLKSQRQT